MSVRLNETSQQALAADAPVTSLPCTLFGWFHLNGNGSASGDPVNPGAMTLMGLGEAGVADHRLRIHLAQTGLDSSNWDPTAQHVDGVSLNAAINNAAPSVDEWFRVMAVFTPDGVTLYFGDAAPVTAVASLVAPPLDTLDIGRLNWSSMIQHFRGYIAETAVWSAALDSVDYENLATQSPALVRSDALAWYRPLIGQANGESFEVGSQDLSTINGPTFVSSVHPPVEYPSVSDGAADNTNAGDPSCWLLLYNTADADATAWATTYAQRRHIPVGNRLGFDLPTSETIDEASFEDLRDAIEGHIESNNLEGHIAGIVCGYGVPGGIQTADGSIDPLPLRLQRGGGSAPVANPLHTADLAAMSRPGPTTLAGDRMVARIDAPTLTDAVAMIDRADAVSSEAISGNSDGGGAVYLNPYPPEGAAYEARRDQMVAWSESLDRQRLRLPIRLPDNPGVGSQPWFDTIEADGFFWGWADATPPSGFFGDESGRRVFTAPISPEQATAPTLRNANDTSWATRSIAAGYAATAGGTRTLTASAVPRPEPFFEALRRGWTIGEAWHVACPLLRNGLVLIGDPLMTVAMPRAGWDLYGPFASLESAAFDTPIRYLREEERSLVLDESVRPGDGERAAYVLRHVDGYGRSEAGLRQFWVQRSGDSLLPIPDAPAWPDAEGWRPRRAPSRVDVAGVWARSFRRASIDRVRFEQQVAGEPPDAIATAPVDAVDCRFAFEVPAPSDLTRFRVVGVSADGIESPGPWSAWTTTSSPDPVSVTLV